MANFGVRFFPRDLWVGVFVGEREPDSAGWYRTVYICPLPCIVFYFDLRVSHDKEQDRG